MTLAPRPKIRLITFGQPRLGNKAFAQFTDQLLPGSIRYTHAKDPVPHIPFQWQGESLCAPACVPQILWKDFLLT